MPVVGWSSLQGHISNAVKQKEKNLMVAVTTDIKRILLVGIISQ